MLVANIFFLKFNPVVRSVNRQVGMTISASASSTVRTRFTAPMLHPYITIDDTSCCLCARSMIPLSRRTGW